MLDICQSDGWQTHYYLYSKRKDVNLKKMGQRGQNDNIMRSLKLY